MKSFLLAALLLTGSAMAQPLETQADSLSYAIGISVGANLKNAGFESLNPELIAKAIDDILRGQAPLLDVAAASGIINTCMGDQQRKKGDASRAKGEAFLATNKTKAGIITLADGLQYEVLKKGTGPIPKASDNVKVHYHGTLIDGTVFDSSVDRGEPTVFGVTQVIPGWTEILEMMPVGSKYRIYLPSNLAYGEQGAGGIIGPNEVLIFEVELLRIMD